MKSVTARIYVDHVDRKPFPDAPFPVELVFNEAPGKLPTADGKTLGYFLWSREEAQELVDELTAVLETL